MDLFDIAKMLWRRWYVVLPIGAVTLAVALLVHVTTPPEYEATGWLVLETPELDDAESRAAHVDPVELAEGIDLNDGEGNFTVSLLGGSNYSIAAIAPNAQGAEDTVATVLTRLNERLNQLQEGDDVPPELRVEVRMVEPEVVAEAQPDGTYLATATAFLYDPTSAVDNPYLANASTGRLLQVAVTGDAARQEFAEQVGPGVDYEVGQQARDAAPLLQVVTMGGDPQRVIDAFYVVREMMAEDLDDRQARADVAPDQRISLGVLDAPLTPIDESPPVGRAAAGVLVLGGLLALGVAIGVDSVQHGRQVGDDPSPDLAASSQRSDPSATDPRDADFVSGSGDGDTGWPPSEIRSEVGRELDLPGGTANGVATNGARRRAPASQAPSPDVVRSRPVSYQGASGTTAGHLAIPASGQGPGVLVIHEWWGLDDAVRTTTERLASEGFVAFAPDLYDGVTTRHVQEADELMQGLEVEAATRELQAGLDFLERQSQVSTDEMGVLGTSMGGGLVLVLAAAEPGRVAAGVCYYPVGGHDEVDLTRVTAAILGHVGSDDEFMSPDQVQQLASVLERSQAPSVQIHSYDRIGHFFLDQDNRFGTYDEELATSTWRATSEFLAGHLGAKERPAVSRFSSM